MIFIILTFFLQTQAGVIVKPEELYENYSDINFCDQQVSDEELFNCLTEDPVQTDIACRYGASGLWVSCYCSGAIFVYVEYGKICTRYSFRESAPEPKYGNDPIIILPFNWGDELPQQIYTDDGRNYSLEEYQFRKTSFPLYPAFQPLIKVEEEKVVNVKRYKSHIKDMNVYLAHQLLMHLYQEEEDNILFSPVSLQIVLSLLYEGAEEGSKTKEELRSVLVNHGRIANPDVLRKSSRTLMKHVEDLEEIQMSNQIFLSLKAQQNFAELAFDYYNAEMIYFFKNETNWLKNINDIISNKTGGYITSPIKTIDDTSMLIINSLLIEASWLVQFNRTKSDMIFNFGNKSEEVPAMNVVSPEIGVSTFTVQNQEVRVVTIPMKNQDHIEMRIYQPLSVHPPVNQGYSILTLMKLLQEFDDENIFEHELDVKRHYKDINLTMPVFSLRKTFKVTKFLKSQGATSMFTDDAQLNNMVAEKLVVKDVTQEIYVEVSETGTKAAAATFVDLATLSASSPEIIEVNTPFIFTIWSKTFQMPLVVGLFKNPDGAELAKSNENIQEYAFK